MKGKVIKVAAVAVVGTLAYLWLVKKVDPATAIKFAFGTSEERTVLWHILTLPNETRTA